MNFRTDLPRTPVVVGTDRTADVHGEGFGAVTLQLATIGRCPVAVVPASQKAARAGVVVGIGGSFQSMAAAYFAAAEATSTEQELVVIYVSSGISGCLHGSTLGSAIAEQDEAAGGMFLETAVACPRARHINPTVDERFEHGDLPTSALIDAGKGAAMLVVGNRGRGVVQQAHMTSSIQGLLLHVPCPVVLIQQDYVDDTTGQIIGGKGAFHPGNERAAGQ